MFLLALFIFLLQYNLVFKRYKKDDTYSNIRIAKEVKKHKKIQKKLGCYFHIKPADFNCPSFL